MQAPEAAESCRRALRIRAANAVAHTRSLTAQEPAWASEVHALAGGWLVLAGAGTYVNQAMAAGIDAVVTEADLDLHIERSCRVGVTPTFEVANITLAESRQALKARGFEHVVDRDIGVVVQAVNRETAQGTSPTDIVIRPVRSTDDLKVWQETAAFGWQITTEAARRPSDAFAAAAYAVATEHFVLAYDAVDDRPLGCAATTISEGVAVLGGMSTVPAERRRGVQAALIDHRLRHARGLGCDLAVSTAARESASERNLLRHGFVPLTTIEMYELRL